MDTRYKLITIPPSHYCEKARWGLELFGAGYTEERHPPMLHYAACRRAGGGRTTPVLVTDAGVYPDSTEILQFLDRRHADHARLYPDDSRRRAQVDELEDLFDLKLGPHTRRLAYFHLLKHKDLFLGSVLIGASGGERFVFRTALPVIRALMRKGMRIDAESAQRSLARIREVFQTVNGLLADGRPYLVGSDFSAADLTFSALAAPVLLPRGYGAPLPSLADLPNDMLDVVEEMRSSVPGEFAMRMYRDHR